MDQPSNPAFLDDITGALDWWRDAGVDLDFVDEPTAWLAPPEPDDRANPIAERRPVRAPAADVEAAPPPARLDPASLPAQLAAFAPWWLSEPLLCGGELSTRIAPQGPAGPDLMIVVEEPEAQDREALLSGPQGKLLDAMLSAFGTRREDIYLASALPRHTPGPDWPALQERGLGQVLAHHVSLVAPKRLIVLGGNALSLIGHESPQGPAVLRSFNHEGASIPLLASWALTALLGQPRAKPVLWKAWLEWTAA
ncbi:hypothetical protein V474_11215 [Novosphingobium barchaimii LL02]|uniref:Uracil-DNA glycosylase-like domain-containing protein n=1 Tax=Novosphingobium barchaimii LL02 TaxID=1114963 RepID=A0A0J7Y7Y4_9SPHN|nr:uracil-DNA glycosylase family protein [Novosphingobium barchaimii]KMS59757.1 hypothetical protein V474_11215 [Novosphingobium barchaimii LL02]